MEKVQTSGIYKVVKEGDGGAGFEVTDELVVSAFAAPGRRKMLTLDTVLP